MNTQIIRKNAQKKLDALFAAATKITVETQYMDSYTDGYDYVSRTSNIDEVKEFMTNNYYSLRVTLVTDENGNHDSLVIRTSGWSKHEFTLSFLPQPPARIETATVQDEPIKPRMTFEMVQAYLKAGFISPLNHGAKYETATEDLDKSIVAIKVIFSESAAFNAAMRDGDSYINKFATLDQYNRLTWLTLAEQKRWQLENGEYGGYDKTQLELTTARGQTVRFRHDISVREPSLTASWSEWVDYCRKEEKRA
uniref:Uncharacterized protein n=1 Tax=Enterovibrio norvegicus TaxID=188144 RepID=A0A0H4A2Y4_9GAMM|nr:hypothetical protein [Enterovibrio norvegicus]